MSRGKSSTSNPVKEPTIVIAERLREDRRRRYKYCASLDQQNLRLDLSRSVLVGSEHAWSLCRGHTKRFRCLPSNKQNKERGRSRVWQSGNKVWEVCSVLWIWTSKIFKGNISAVFLSKCLLLGSQSAGVGARGLSADGELLFLDPNELDFKLAGIVQLLHFKSASVF